MAETLAAKIEGTVEGELVDFRGGVLHVLSEKAYPPGRPMTLAVASEPAMSLAGRAIGSKRQQDDRFLVRLRLTNLRKTDRELLQATFE